MKKKVIIFTLIAIVIIGIIATVVVLNSKNENKENNLANDATPTTEVTINHSPTPISDVNKMTEQEKSIFNSNFDFYAGNNIKGNRVKSLIQTILHSNEHSSIGKVDLVINGTKVIDSSNIKNTNSYSVSFEYNNNGLICKAIIEEN